MPTINLLDDFARWLRTNETSPKTIQDYTAIVRRMTAWILKTYSASFENDDVKGYMISNWATTLAELAPATRQLYNIVARKYLGFLYDLQYTSFDLRGALPKLPSLEKQYAIHPETRPDKGAYTKEQVRQMLDFKCRNRLNTARNRAIIATLVTTGLRVSEMLALTVGDALGEGTAMIPRKGTHGIPVKVFIPVEIQPILKEYLALRKDSGANLAADAPLFAWSTGKPMSRSDVYRAISGIEKALGIPTGVHTFRHTALSEISRVADPATARDVAGQKKIDITNRYLHSTDEDMMNATAKLTEIFCGNA